MRTALRSRLGTPTAAITLVAALLAAPATSDAPRPEVPGVATASAAGIVAAGGRVGFDLSLIDGFPATLTEAGLTALRSTPGVLVVLARRSRRPIAHPTAG